MSNSSKCPCCGVAYKDHLGVQGTCLRLQSMLTFVRTMRRYFRDLGNDRMVIECDDTLRLNTPPVIHKD